MTRSSVRAALAVALVLSGAAPAVAAVAPAADAEGDVVVRYAFALTDDPDRVRVVATLASVPEDVPSFRFEPDAPGLAVVATDGFARRDGDLVWDGRTADATVTYTVPRAPGASSGGSGDGTADGGARSADGDEREGNGLGTAGNPGWAYLATGQLTMPYSYRYYGADPGVDVRVEAGGPGTSGSTVVYLGRYGAARRTVGGQTVRLIEPAAADLPSRDRVFRALADARRALRVGAVDDRLDVFVATAPIRRGGVTFPQRDPGRQDFWVRDDVPLDAPGNTWIHEHVHTRQAYETSDELRWFDEASAEYYAGLLTLRRGAVPFDRFRGHVAAADHAGARLSAPRTWSSDRVPYAKGRRVLAALDARIRRASGGDATLQAVFRRMNAQEGPVTYDDFRGFVADAAGTPLDGWLDRYVRGTEAPPVPDDPARYTDPRTPDTDGDGLDDAREVDGRTSPFAADTDGDGILDDEELRGPTDPVAGDTDGDGLADGAEREHAASPTVPDTDADGLTDGAEVAFGSSPTLADADLDGLDDPAERRFGSDPRTVDSDGDGLGDAREREVGADPWAAHSDGDGLPDVREARLGTDPASRFTDRDRLPDPRELELGTDPTRRDTDRDGAGDARERRAMGTDPLVADTDGDGILDGAEASAGTDPTEETGDVAYLFAKLF